MVGYSHDKTALAARLKRAEGQVRGIAKMVDEDRYCIEVLDQISAVNRALQAVAIELLQAHLAHCVADAAREGGAAAVEKVEEAAAAVARLVKS